MTSLGVLLAAGAGTRFSASRPGAAHKLLAPLRGRPLIEHSLSSMLAAGLDECAVVTGAVDMGAVVTGATVLHNPEWATGQRSSLLVAIAHARSRGHEAIVVGLADQPFVTPAAWRRVADCDSPIAAASYRGRRGNPVRLHKSVWPALEGQTDDPDAGARSLMSRSPELVRLVECDGDDTDIDTVDDLDSHQ